MSTTDLFDLERFVTAQAPVIATVLAELRADPETESLDVVRVPATAPTRALLNGRRSMEARRCTKLVPISPIRFWDRGSNSAPARFWNSKPDR
jgi:hypothetical protein